MAFEFHSLEKAKRAAKALMHSTNDRYSNYVICVRGENISLNDDPVFGGIDLRFNGKIWKAEIDGKEYKDSAFLYHGWCDYYLEIKAQYCEHDH